MTYLKKGILSVIVISAAFIAGVWYRGRNQDVSSANSTEHSIKYWYDPMHPSYRSDKPGIAPDCGMQLEAMYGDGPAKENALVEQKRSGIMVSADRQQILGIRTARVEKSAIAQGIRLLGRVAVDETQIYRLISTTDGWVRDISPYPAGSIVSKDQLLATYFARELLTPESGYIFALNTRDRRNAAEVDDGQNNLTNNQVRSAEDSLINLGMSQIQINELAKSRKASSIMQVRAPADGVILSRNVASNLRIDRFTELYRMADISHVVILVDVFERDSDLIPVGGNARVRYHDRAFAAKISKTLPIFDPSTRTLKLRLELENPGYILRPEMFVDVEIPVRLATSVVVPADAVIDTGLHKRVFVDQGDGFFESREIETGWRMGDRVQVVKGLSEGERIVVSGTFLIDSESRMKAETAGIKGIPAIDPVCGMNVDEMKAKTEGRATSYSGKTFYFCSISCKQNFDKDPAKYGAIDRKLQNTNQ